MNFCINKSSKLLLLHKQLMQMTITMKPIKFMKIYRLNYWLGPKQSRILHDCNAHCHCHHIFCYLNFFLSLLYLEFEQYILFLFHLSTRYLWTFSFRNFNIILFKLNNNQLPSRLPSSYSNEEISTRVVGRLTTLSSSSTFKIGMASSKRKRRSLGSRFMNRLMSGFYTFSVTLKFRFFFFIKLF